MKNSVYPSRALFWDCHVSWHNVLLWRLGRLWPAWINAEHTFAFGNSHNHILPDFFCKSGCQLTPGTLNCLRLIRFGDRSCIHWAGDETEDSHCWIWKIRQLCREPLLWGRKTLVQRHVWMHFRVRLLDPPAKSLQIQSILTKLIMKSHIIRAMVLSVLCKSNLLTICNMCNFFVCGTLES